MSLSEVFKTIKVVRDFPKKDIVFRHIGPLLKNTRLFKYAIQKLFEKSKEKYDIVCGLDARGFIIATAIQHLADLPQVMIRKSSKLPGNVFTSEFQKEYGKDSFQLEAESIQKGQRVLIVDDLMATGGSLMSSIDLVIQAGGIVSGIMTLIEFRDLNARKRIQDKYPEIKVYSLFSLDSFNDSTDIENIDYLDCKLFRPQKFGSVFNSDDNNSSVLMWHPTMETFAKNILQVSKGIRPSYINWDYFPDKWPNITFERSETLVNKNLIFIMSLSTKELLTEQLALLVAMPRQLINSLTIVIPYLGPATHERVDFSGQLATVEPILKMISSCIPMTKSGPPIVRIFDIHALQTRFYVNDNITMKLMSAIPVLLNYIETKTKTTQKHYAIAYPDDGAYKRFKYFFDEYPQIICSKIRDGDTRKIIIREKFNWPEEYVIEDVIIIDDLVQSGETLLKCAEALKTYGFKNISAYVTHAVFPNNAWEKFTNSLVIDEFIITNTNPSVSDKLEGVKPFVVLNVSIQLCKELMINNPNIGIYSNPNPKKLVNVYVATTNEDKLASIYDAMCARNSMSSIFKFNNDCIYDIYAVDGINSGVSEQPFSIEETTIGAMNRLERCIDKVRRNTNNTNNTDTNTNNDIFIAIENGIVVYDEKYYDVPVFAYKIGEEDIEKAVGKYSATCIPEKYEKFVLESLETFNKTKTFGSIMSRAFGIKDWHKFVSNYSRRYLLQSAIHYSI